MKQPPIDDRATTLFGARGTANLEERGDLLALVVAFANGDVAPEWTTRAPRIEGHYIGARLRPYGTAGMVIISEDEARAEANRQLGKERDFAKVILAAAAKGRTSLTESLLTHEDVLVTIGMEPVFELQGGKPSLRWRTYAPTDSTKSWVILAGILVATGANSEQTEIGSCHLSTCGRFFLIKKGLNGRPPSKYCSEDHRLQRHALDSAARQRKSRAARKKRVVGRSRRYS